MIDERTNAIRRIPIILDTDIGDDIDDTWAIAMMLKSPELDVRLITTDTGDTTYRARIVAKLLEAAGRTDIPIGIGPPLPGKVGPQGPWVADYDLSRYPGRIHRDGVQALIDTIMSSREPVTLICIGPLPNIGEALRREPRIAQRARFIGMHGSIRKGYNGSDQIAPEYNVKLYTPACRPVFVAGWSMTITPLDTCGLVKLAGEKYKAVRDCQDPLIRAMIDNYRIWARNVGWAQVDTDSYSTTLYDTVAVYLAFSEDLLVMENLPLRVTDDGYTMIDEKAGKVVHCATAWKDLPAYEDFLVKRLIG